MILHYGGMWLFIGQVAPNKPNCYSLTPNEWEVLKPIHVPTAKLMIIAKHKFAAKITKI